MDLALPALAIAYVVIPGLVLVRAYRGQLGARFGGISLLPGGLTSDFVWAVLLAPAPHSAAIGITTVLTDLEPAPAFVVHLLSDTSSRLQQQAMAALSDNLLAVSLYLPLAATLGFAFGAVAHQLVRRFQLDWRFGLLRFPNPWHYLIEAPDTAELQYMGSFAAVTVEFAGRGYLYLGTVTGYDIDANGDLVRMQLDGVLRRDFGADAAPAAPLRDPYSDERFYPIEGDHFVLDMRAAKTLNIIHAFAERPALEGWMFRGVEERGRP